MNTNQSPESPTPDLQIAPPLDLNRRNGKVARLPRPIRNKINTMILDGVPYREIIKRLSPDTDGLTESNLSNWKDGGYLDWLRELHISEALQAKYELAKNIVDRCGDDNAAGQAVLHSMATNLCEFLAEMDPAILRESILSDADKFTKFVNSMVRLAEGGIKCQLHKFRMQDRALEAAKLKTSAETPGISHESLLKAEQALNLL